MKKLLLIFAIFSAILIFAIFSWQPAYAAFQRIVYSIQISSGLVGYWSFNANNIDWTQSSAEARDVSGVGNHGNITNFGQEAARPGISGQALSFDGSNDYIDIGSGTNLNISGDLTL